MTAGHVRKACLAALWGVESETALETSSIMKLIDGFLGHAGKAAGVQYDVTVAVTGSSLGLCVSAE